MTSVIPRTFPLISYDKPLFRHLPLSSFKLYLFEILVGGNEIGYAKRLYVVSETMNPGKITCFLWFVISAQLWISRAFIYLYIYKQLVFKKKKEEREIQQTLWTGKIVF